ncbi:MAG: GDP-mannose 4,6-dehydratase [Candidatus Falkowbacteria bacterium]
MSKLTDNKIKNFKHRIKSVTTGPRALVDGGAGFIGSNLCGRLLEKGYEVFAVDNLITGKLKNISRYSRNQRFHFIETDINDPGFPEIFQDIKINEIYHLACPTGVPNIKKLGEEMITTCSLGTLNIMSLARAQSASIVYSSSAEIYGQPEETPQNEHYTGNVNPIGPRSAYEEGKRFAESIIKMYADKYGLNAKIVRIFNTYGPGMSLSDQRVMPQFLQSIIRGKKLTIYGDGSQTRTFLYVSDLLSGLELVMKKGKPGEAYNVGGDSQITIKDLAELMKKLTGYRLDVEFVPHFIEDHNHRQPAVSKAELLGWRQTVSLEEGLKKMIAANGVKLARPIAIRSVAKDSFTVNESLSAEPMLEAGS